MKNFAIILVLLKCLIALPCVGWGLLIGVFGIGPDGWVPAHFRPIGLCAFFGGAALGFPHSIWQVNRILHWIIGGLGCSPSCLFFALFVKEAEVWEDPVMWGVAVVFAAAVVLSLMDILVATRLRPTAHPPSELAIATDHSPLANPADTA